MPRDGLRSTPIPPALPAMLGTRWSGVSNPGVRHRFGTQQVRDRSSPVESSDDLSIQPSEALAAHAVRWSDERPHLRGKLPEREEQRGACALAAHCQISVHQLLQKADMPAGAECWHQSAAAVSPELVGRCRPYRLRLVMIASAASFRGSCRSRDSASFALTFANASPVREHWRARPKAFHAFALHLLEQQLHVLQLARRAGRRPLCVPARLQRTPWSVQGCRQPASAPVVRR